MACDIPKQLTALKLSASSGFEILTDKNDAKFQKYAERWSDIDRQVPAAIILPESEEQIQQIVKWAVASSVPFVAKSGGHSLWSTIGENGVVIDLSKFSGIEIDGTSRTATLKGSIVNKQVAVALAEAGLFTALGNGNSIGAIPYFLGGGVSTTTALTGFGSDQILGARIITASGDLLEVSKDKEPDLLYAIRGAGQFFGLVTQLTVQAFPLSDLGSSDGTIWVGKFIFPLGRAKEVGAAMESIMNDSNHLTTGLMVTMLSPPPKREPAIMIAGRYIGNPEEAKVAYQKLYDLKPAITGGGSVPIQNSNDGRESMEVHGECKRYNVTPLRRFDLQKWLSTTQIWKQLIAECPDAGRSAYWVQWDSRNPKQPATDSAVSLHDIRFWQVNMSWYSGDANRSLIEKHDKEATATMRGSDRTEYADFANTTRNEPIEFRYRPAKKLDKLMTLKKKWDPQGVFTSQLLA